MTNARTVSAGLYHSCSISLSGSASCWGENGNGELGIGSLAPSSVPTPVASRTAQISAGAYHTCRARGDGQVECFGYADLGQVGPAAAGNQTVPIEVTGLGRLKTGPLLAGHYTHNCGLPGDGTLLCWGSNDGFASGGTASNYMVPTVVPGVTDAVALGTGDLFHCVLDVAGRVWCMGANDYGQLGQGTIDSALHPPGRVLGISGATALAVGTNHACAVLGDGTVRCWGANFYGQMGDGSWSTRATPVAVLGATRIKSIESWSYFTCGVSVSGQVFCWGENSYAQRGNSSTVTTNTGNWVPSLDSVISVATGFTHTCALKSNGELSCWGSNEQGELGNGVTSGPVYAPTLVMGNTVAVSAGWRSTCSITANGLPYCWGQNFYGQLGFGYRTLTGGVLTPTRVGLTGVLTVESANFSTCFARVDGTVWCAGWYNDPLGLLGTGSPVNSSVPVRAAF
jgi:alpha-tubulin suppressor-like RCC1 family protein